MGRSKRSPLVADESWLPPASLATIIGIALFTTYIGSAVLSALPFGPKTTSTGVGALYTRAEEVAYCRQTVIPPADADVCFAPVNTTSNRVIYMQP